MKLTTLSRNELNNYFLNINSRYIAMLEGPINDYFKDPEFLKVREQLRQVLYELQRRRQQPRKE